MVDTVLRVAYFVILFASEAIRAPHRARNSRDRLRRNVADTRVAGLETALMTLAFVGMWVVPALYVFTPWFAFADYGLPVPVRIALGVLGAGAGILGLWLLVRAHADLGRNWSPSLEIKREQALVTGGVYRYVRHPIYAAMWLLMLAQALLLQNAIGGLAGLAVYLPTYLLRVPREERMMVEHFGEAYRRYMERTGRVVPRLGR